MVNFMKEQQVKIVEFYLQNDRSIILTHFNIRNGASSVTMIRKLMQCFKEAGSVMNLAYIILANKVWLARKKTLNDLKPVSRKNF